METQLKRQIEDGAPSVTRREFLAQAGAFTGVTMLGPLAAPSRAAANTATALPELISLNALDLSQKIRSKQVSCVEAMQPYLAHIDRFNPKVHAIVSLQPADVLLQQAKERDTQLARGEILAGCTAFPTR